MSWAIDLDRLCAEHLFDECNDDHDPRTPDSCRRAMRDRMERARLRHVAELADGLQVAREERDRRELRRVA